MLLTVKATRVLFSEAARCSRPTARRSPSTHPVLPPDLHPPDTLSQGPSRAPGCPEPSLLGARCWSAPRIEELPTGVRQDGGAPRSHASERGVLSSSEAKPPACFQTAAPRRVRTYPSRCLPGEVHGVDADGDGGHPLLRFPEVVGERGHLPLGHDQNVLFEACGRQSGAMGGSPVEPRRAVPPPASRPPLLPMRTLACWASIHM